MPVERAADIKRLTDIPASGAVIVTWIPVSSVGIDIEFGVVRGGALKARPFGQSGPVSLHQVLAGRRLAQGKG
jgi:hypothetical protein